VGEGGGGQKWTQLASLITFIGGGCERGEGEGREGKDQICPCTKCSLYACSFILCLPFSYLRSAVAASFDIKKFHRNVTTTTLFPRTRVGITCVPLRRLIQSPAYMFTCK